MSVGYGIAVGGGVFCPTLHDHVLAGCGVVECGDGGAAFEYSVGLGFRVVDGYVPFAHGADEFALALARYGARGVVEGDGRGYLLEGLSLHPWVCASAAEEEAVDGGCHGNGYLGYVISGV